MAISRDELPWEGGGEPVAVPLADVLLAAGAVALAMLIAAERSYLAYLGWLLGDLQALWWAVPAVAVASALVTVWWALVYGGPHRTAVPLLTVSVLIWLAGVIGWAATMY